MSTVNTHTDNTHTVRSFWTGRSELVVVAVLYLVAILLTIGTALMNVQGRRRPVRDSFRSWFASCCSSAGPPWPSRSCASHTFLTTGCILDMVNSPPTCPRHRPGAHRADDSRDRGCGARLEPAPKLWKTFSDWRTVGLTFGAVGGIHRHPEPRGMDPQRHHAVLGDLLRPGQQTQTLRPRRRGHLRLVHPACLQRRPGPEPAFGLPGRDSLMEQLMLLMEGFSHALTPMNLLWVLSVRCSAPPSAFCRAWVRPWP